jgi:hypothetical protein
MPFVLTDNVSAFASVAWKVIDLIKVRMAAENSKRVI